jgi:hypothetical protein
MHRSSHIKKSTSEESFVSTTSKSETNKKFKTLEAAEIKQKIIELSKLIININYADANICRMAYEILHPEDIWYGMDQIQAIIQSEGKENSPLRLSIKYNLPLTFMRLFFEGGCEVQLSPGRRFTWHSAEEIRALMRGKPEFVSSTTIYGTSIADKIVTPVSSPETCPLSSPDQINNPAGLGVPTLILKRFDELEKEYLAGYESEGSQAASLPPLSLQSSPSQSPPNSPPASSRVGITRPGTPFFFPASLGSMFCRVALHAEASQEQFSTEPELTVKKVLRLGNGGQGGDTPPLVTTEARASPKPFNF